jgi:hypothetical protein
MISIKLGVFYEDPSTRIKRSQISTNVLFSDFSASIIHMEKSRGNLSF